MRWVKLDKQDRNKKQLMQPSTGNHLLINTNIMIGKSGERVSESTVINSSKNTCEQESAHYKLILAMSNVDYIETFYENKSIKATIGSYICR